MVQTVLFITLGAGVGIKKDERIKELAHGLNYFIDHYQPDYCVFFGTNLSQETLEQMKKDYLKDFSSQFPKHEFIILENYDKIRDVYETIKSKIDEFKESRVIINYVSGTKSMTVAAAIVGLLFKKKLAIVGGKRRSTGIVGKGLEEIIEQNIAPIYDDILFEDVSKAFNEYRFQTAIEISNRIISEEYQADELKNIIELYQYWDIFNHEKAKTILESKEKDLLNKVLEIEQVNKNKKAINYILEGLRIFESNNEKVKKNIGKFYLICDLIQNAKRRMKEYKFDDAVARLYRCTELIAQICLLDKVNVKTGNLDLNLIEKFAEKNNIELDQQKLDVLNSYRKTSEKDKIKIGLYQSYELLSWLQIELGEIFINNKRLQNLLTKRNESILAHGTLSIGKEIAKQLLEEVEKLAKTYMNENKYESISAELKFPKMINKIIIR
ncbi:MAG: TIGR02710 family CRISPR-associated CARF protein [Promethearchaeota archaeon]